ncbi:adenine-specific methyltransferase EcoRI family protein [Succinivibrio sp.]|uniref:adenine-specific methyltransferase EcoRI family protein n=1 Tax=Succinivibrio sp. TaxID=2053619 RepID=UPI003864C374
MANTNLSKAKNAKNDEFYTQYADIQKEINAYLEYDKDVFRDKTLLLTCDDPEWSNFTKFFAQNFENFGLKKLISTSYAIDSKYQKYGQLDLFDDADFIKNNPNYDFSKNAKKWQDLYPDKKK